MFYLDYSDTIEDVLIYKNKIYIVEKNEITSKSIEENLLQLKFEDKNNIIDSKIEYSRMPSLSKIFYIMVFNNKYIPNVESLFNMYIQSCFIENKDHTYSEKDFSIKYPKRYSYIGLKSRVYNDYLLLIKYYHFYLMLNESRKFDKVIYSIKNEIHKGLNLNISYNNKYYRILVYINGTVSIDRKNGNREYINIYKLEMNDNLQYKINNFNIFNKKIIEIIEEKIIEDK